MKGVNSLNGSYILAISLSSRGFGFAIFQGPKRLIDWGLKAAHGDKNAICQTEVLKLFRHFQPAVVVLENSVVGVHRHTRIKWLSAQVTALAKEHDLRVVTIKRTVVQQHFASRGAGSRYEVAQTIAHEFEGLLPRLPRIRRAWMTEDTRIHIFHAVAIALTFFAIKTEGIE